LGYRGLVVTDDLEMKAIADHYAIEDVAVCALLAGVDVLLCCHGAELARRAISAIVTGVKTGLVPEARLVEAAERTRGFARRWARSPERGVDLSILGSPEHRAVVERILQRDGGRTS
ncbi:MAG TPA: glycoside hydrolase family 3 N-terminal domain-containing protein, partial [Polyangiaceae bacterium]